MKSNYVVYVGDTVKYADVDILKAKAFYDTLPSGQGKRPSLRRSLVKEITIEEDLR